MKSASTRFGFTWFEVMMVVIILGLLGAVFLPSVFSQILNQANAKRMHCTSNQRQILLGMTVYANDHEGRFPIFTCDGSGRWMMAGDSRLDPTSTAIASLELMAFFTGGDLSRKQFTCPSKPNAKPQAEARNTGETSAISPWAVAGAYTIGYAYDWSVPADAETLSARPQSNRVVVADRDRQAHQKLGCVVAAFSDGHTGILKKTGGNFLNHDANDDDIYTDVNDGPMSLPGQGSTTRAFVR